MFKGANKQHRHSAASWRVAVLTALALLHRNTTNTAKICVEA